MRSKKRLDKLILGRHQKLLLYGDNRLCIEIYRLISDVWLGAHVPQDWIDAILISLLKGKGSKSMCGDYIGIILLEAVGKVFAKLLLDRLTKWVCSSVIPESQCGFRSGRGTMDMIFSARQLQEKCIEHRVALYQVFVDLTKAFDTVNSPLFGQFLVNMAVHLNLLTCLNNFIVT